MPNFAFYQMRTIWKSRWKFSGEKVGGMSKPPGITSSVWGSGGELRGAIIRFFWKGL